MELWLKIWGIEMNENIEMHALYILPSFLGDIFDCLVSYLTSNQVQSVVTEFDINTRPTAQDMLN